jgi:hypothetical protein
VDVLFNGVEESPIAGDERSLGVDERSLGTVERSHEVGVTIG